MAAIPWFGDREPGWQDRAMDRAPIRDVSPAASGSAWGSLATWFESWIGEARGPDSGPEGCLRVDPGPVRDGTRPDPGRSR